MAKTDKSGKAKLPKKVAGVKVPKSLRKLGGLDKLIASPTGRQILADVLVAAAAAAAAALVKNRDQVAEAGVAVVDAGADAASGTKDLVQSAAGAVAEVVGDAARQILPTALGGTEKESRPKAEARDDVFSEAAYADDGKKKRNRDKHKPSEH